MNFSTENFSYDQMFRIVELCEGCRNRIIFIGGRVFDKEQYPFAKFMAVLQEHARSYGAHGDYGDVTIVVEFEFTNDQGQVVEDRPFCLMLSNQDGLKFNTEIMDPNDLTGKTLSREEVLKRPFSSWLSDFGNFIAKVEQEILEFLTCY